MICNKKEKKFWNFRSTLIVSAGQLYIVWGLSIYDSKGHLPHELLCVLQCAASINGCGSCVQILLQKKNPTVFKKYMIYTS